MFSLISSSNDMKLMLKLVFKSKVLGRLDRYLLILLVANSFAIEARP